MYVYSLGSTNPSIMFDHTPFLCSVLLFSFILCVSSHFFVNSCDRLTERLHMANCKMTIMDAQLQGWYFLLRSIVTLTLQRTVLPFKDHWVWFLLQMMFPHITTYPKCFSHIYWNIEPYTSSSFFFIHLIFGQCISAKEFFSLLFQALLPTISWCRKIM